MPLLNDELSVWEIAFRWADHDPDKLWIRCPLLVRDNFRTLLDAILNGHLFCTTLALEKWDPNAGSQPEFFIRHYIDEVHACIQGQRFNRKLLRFAVIERWSMQQWCERWGIPLPAFWFPPGWNIEYERPGEGLDASSPKSPQPDVDSLAPQQTESSMSLCPAPAAEKPEETATERESVADGKRTLDRRQRGKIACQEVAIRLWRTQPGADMKVIAGSQEVQKLAGGEDYEFEVVLRWLSEIDPRDPAKKRGPKKKTI